MTLKLNPIVFVMCFIFLFLLLQLRIHTIYHFFQMEDKKKLLRTFIYFSSSLTQRRKQLKQENRNEIYDVVDVPVHYFMTK